MRREASPERVGAESLEHRTLAGGVGASIETARCTDRAKLGVVLQGAGLLSLCDAVGWSLAGSWREARVDGRGCLSGLRARPGRDRTPVQSRLRELLHLLFHSRGRVAGRGEARRAARELGDVWESALVPMSSDDAIGLMFESAPFLWCDELGPAREALRGGFEREGRRSDWIAGPPAVRRRIVGAGAGGPSPVAAPLELLSRARWNEAARIWQERPPASDAERFAHATARFALGRFESAELLVADREESAALGLRAHCRLLLGELAAARELVDRLDVRELSAAERIEHGDVALRVCSLSRDPATARDWAAKAIAAARTDRERALGRLLQATAAFDAGDAAAAERLVAEVSEELEGTSETWRLHQLRAWLALERGDGEALVAHARAELGSRRRKMRRFEAGRAWSNLGLGYLIRGELGRAERAFEQSVRLLRRCDGPLAVTLAQTNLAEARLRAGKLLEVEPILKASSAHNRRSGNAPALAADEELWVRFELVRGDPEAALRRAGRARDAAPSGAAGGALRLRPGLAALAARAAGWLETPEAAARWVELAGAAGVRELEPEELPGYFALAGELERARQEALAGRHAAVWLALLRGEAPAADAFAVLDELDAFRRARLVLDAELVVAGSVPPPRRAEAAATFRRIGANRYALRLERGGHDAWTSLRRYLDSAGDRRARLESIGELLRSVGHPEATLAWRDAAGEERLVEGDATALDEISGAAANGRTLALQASWIDEALRAVFALLLRDLPAAETVPPGFAATGESEGPIAGRDPKLFAALKRLRQFAASDMPVLVLGESGTGKELAAREVRRLSDRAELPWVAVNCAALSETLLLSDLFGHARGAFTGADRPRAGVFESAQGGTVFLDEIGDLPPIAQGNLLRVLQEGEVRRLGESLPRKVEFRLVAATHRDLARMVRDGAFRQDLYYRLKVCTVTLPPLRDRGDDVELLAERFVEEERRRRSLVHLQLTAEARRRLRAHSWPGNVRELAHLLKAAAALCGDGPITAAALDLDAAASETPVSDYHREVDDFRRAILRGALAAHRGNRAAAARQLGVSRQALSYLVRELDLDSERES